MSWRSVWWGGDPCVRPAICRRAATGGCPYGEDKPPEYRALAASRDLLILPQWIPDMRNTPQVMVRLWSALTLLLERHTNRYAVGDPSKRTRT